MENRGKWIYNGPDNKVNGPPQIMVGTAQYGVWGGFLTTCPPRNVRLSSAGSVPVAESSVPVIFSLPPSGGATVCGLIQGAIGGANGSPSACVGAAPRSWSQISGHGRCELRGAAWPPCGGDGGEVGGGGGAEEGDRRVLRRVLRRVGEHMGRPHAPRILRAGSDGLHRRPPRRADPHGRGGPPLRRRLR